MTQEQLKPLFSQQALAQFPEDIRRMVAQFVKGDRNRIVFFERGARVTPLPGSQSTPEPSPPPQEK